MPIDVLTNADQVRILGPVNIATDPNNNSSGNLTVSGAATVIGSFSGQSGANLAGPLVVTSSASFASGVTVSSLSAGGWNASFTGGATVQGGLNYDVVTGGLPGSTTSSQSLSTGSQINMTSGVSASGAHVVYVSAASTTATVALTPTSSASTSGVYQNGLEVTVINLAASGSNVLIPTSSAGASQQNAVTISAGCAVIFKYIAQLQTWIPVMA